MIASTNERIVEEVDSVVDVKDSIDHEIEKQNHTPSTNIRTEHNTGQEDKVREQLENLGYM
jgi:hypothetical protein